MARKIIWVVVGLVVFLGARIGLEAMADNMLGTAELLVEQERYDAAERKLSGIDKWFSWSDAGKRTAEVRVAIDESIASDRKRAEADRQQAELEKAQAQWRAQEQADSRQRQAESGEKPAGVYHGLNKAEKLKQ
jgi:multidrug efflux pump subunit AcrA (membrane-fusion protein)